MAAVPYKFTLEAPRMQAKTPVIDVVYWEVIKSDDGERLAPVQRTTIQLEQLKRVFKASHIMDVET